MLSELELLPSEAVNGFLASLTPHLLAGCPEADRSSLAADLGLLDLEVTMAPAGGGVDVVYTRRSRERAAGSRSRAPVEGGVAPVDARYQPAGGQPTLPEGETDAELFKEVWRMASEDNSPVEVEQGLPVDRYRIRCLFEHRQAEGALDGHLDKI